MAYSRSTRLFSLISLSLLAQISCPSMAAGFWNFNIFEGANIESSDHHGADLKEVSFQGTKMSRANFQDANLVRANFKEADMSEANFKNATLSGANLQNATVTRVNFQGAKFDSINAQNTKMSFSNFETALLQNSNLQNSDLRATNFQGTDLTHTNLQSSDIYQTSFKGAKIAFTNLQGAAMELSSFQDADIQGANFQGVNMTESNFKGAFVHPATAEDNSYTPFGCVPASFRAKVQRDPIKKTYDEKWQKVADKVVKLNLETETCTDFEDASFKETIFYNVNFSNPEHFKNSNLTVAQLCRAQSLYGSTFPKNIMADIKRDKACAKKLTDKALFEQVRDDFLRAQKNK